MRDRHVGPNRQYAGEEWATRLFLLVGRLCGIGPYCAISHFLFFILFSFLFFSNLDFKFESIFV
jgi:hypothetical protein